MELKDDANLRVLVESAPIGICILDAGSFVAEMLNDKFLEIAGKPREAILGKWYWEAFAEARAYYEDAMMGAVSSGKTFYADEAKLMLVRHGVEEDIYVTFVYAPVFGQGGKVNKLAVWVLENTTQVREREKVAMEKIAAEAELEKIKAERADDNLEQVLDLLPASVVIIRGYDLIVEKINRSNLSYWNKTREEVIGRPFLEILPDLADQPFAWQLRKVMETGETIDVKESPVIFTSSDGSQRETYVDYTYQPLSDVSGKITGVLVMSFEITDRVQSKNLLEKYASELASANEGLAVSEARFKFVFQEAPVAIGVLAGRELLVESANAKILEVWGKSPSVIGMKLEDALPELQGQPFLGILDEVFTSGIPFYANEIPAMLEHAGELREIFFNVVYQPVKDARGNVADILVVAVEVTEQVNARKKVEQSEAHFRHLADLIPSKISNALPTGEVTFFNKAWLDFAGMGFEDLRDFGYHQMMHPQEIPAFQVGLAAAASSGVPHVSEMRFKDTSGNYVWHLNIASPVLQDGKIVMWVGSTTDIQSIKEEEQRKSEFISTLSHELKTPITSIRGYVQLLLRMLAKEEKSVLVRTMNTSLSRIDALVGQQTNLIGEMLDLTRIDAGRLDLNKQQFDAGQLAAEVVGDFRLSHPGIVFQLDAPTGVVVEADRDRIGQVLINLIANAVKYSPDSDKVDVSVGRAETEVLISVRDYGIGIDVKDRPKLFERFYRVEGPNEMFYSGFGIGLFLVQDIVSRHGGSVTLESEKGRGSCFTVHLPIS